MYRNYIENKMCFTRYGKSAIQRKLIEEFDYMDLDEMQAFFKARAISISGVSEMVDPKTGEKSLYLSIENFGKATHEDFSTILKGKIRWDHLILEGQRIF